jgi:hypothetical protein
MPQRPREGWRDKGAVYRAEAERRINLDRKDLSMTYQD